jgi:cytochrome c
MTRIRTAILFTLLALAASFALARVHPFGDASLSTAPHATTIRQQSTIPPQLRDTLQTKCGDCHSNESHAPLYARFAPISWLVERDIIAGRHHLDLSAWDTYSPDQQQILESKILQETKSRRMPLPQYRLIHWNATITTADQQALTAWAHGNSPPDSSPQPATPGDPVHGKLTFEKRCTGCHSLEQNREGPNLRTVFNRTAGTAPNFTYSSALQNAHITWNETNLDRWLTDPDAFLPGNNMDFHVPKPQERQDLIAFLKSLPTP